ncbi:MAG: hypothetical protein RR048_06775 [Oscillospiraceae bacterium]
MNDSGKWMYFENGKAVIGKKKIDGVSYEFDQYGALWLKQRNSVIVAILFKKAIVSGA